MFSASLLRFIDELLPHRIYYYGFFFVFFLKKMLITCLIITVWKYFVVRLDGHRMSDMHDAYYRHELPPRQLCLEHNLL